MLTINNEKIEINDDEISDYLEKYENPENIISLEIINKNLASLPDNFLRKYNKLYTLFISTTKFIYPYKLFYKILRIRDFKLSFKFSFKLSSHIENFKKRYKKMNKITSFCNILNDNNNINNNNINSNYYNYNNNCDFVLFYTFLYLDNIKNGKWVVFLKNFERM